MIVLLKEAKIFILKNKNGLWRITMNPVFKALQIHAEASDVCPIHQIPVMEIVGHKLCKLCAEETVHQSQVAYEAELQQRLLQQKIKNSGLNKRYINQGGQFLNAVRGSFLHFR
jgi:hypothetical protein